MYKQKAKNARLAVLDMLYNAQTSHIGSNFSVIDIMTVLFDKMNKEDKVILSAGWKAASFYYFLKKQGHDIDLDTYCQEGSNLIGLTEPGVPGVLFAGGSMQMGLPAAVGFALSKKMKGEDGKVFCLMSDGELSGGMIWESALIAVHYELDNLVIIVDQNGFQAMGTTQSILGNERGSLFFPGTGFYKRSINGHDHKAIEESLIYEDGWALDPLVIFANTVKGKGVSFMENNNLYHYKNLSEDEYLKAKAEIQNG